MLARASSRGRRPEKSLVPSDRLAQYFTRLFLAHVCQFRCGGGSPARSLHCEPSPPFGPDRQGEAVRAAVAGNAPDCRS